MIDSTIGWREEYGQKLRRQRWDSVLGVSALGMAGCFSLVLLLAWLETPGLHAFKPLYPLALPLLWWIWLLRRCPQQWRQVNRDLAEQRVASVTGVVRSEVAYTPGLLHLPKYRIQIGHLRFAVDQATFSAVMPGADYRIIYSPHAEIFLDAVQISAQAKQGSAGLATGRSLQTVVLPPQSAPGRRPIRPGQDTDGVPLPLEPLTRREVELLQLIAAGLSNAEIAQRLSFSVNTVKMYLSQLYRKLDVRRRTEAVARAQQLKIIE